MLNVGRIEEGFVLDHIKAGKAMTIYHDLGLDKLRCITSIEQGLKHVFILADPEKEIYRCKYCDEKYTGNRNK